MSGDVQRVLFSGGVGGARLCDGFYRESRGEELTVIVNTGDDFEHLGLYISPDIDSVLYTLSAQADPERGWGLQDESWKVLERLGQLGGDTWFQLGDKDLATHLIRTARIRGGAPLSTAVAELAMHLDITATILPMTDEPLRTMVHTQEGTLAFQEYFVRRRCEPVVSGFDFIGAEAAKPCAGIASALAAENLAPIIICPSNPFVSVGPALAVPGLAEALGDAPAPVVAVSPIVGGRALKGPAAVMLQQLGYAVSAAGVARYYADTAPGLVDIFVVDDCDAELMQEISAIGMQCIATDIVMSTVEDRRRLARWLMAL